MIAELLMPKAFRTTLPALRSAASNWGTLSVIHFDSHLGNTAKSGHFGHANYIGLDTWDPDVLGGASSKYA